jgi:hypothetical protein
LPNTSTSFSVPRLHFIRLGSRLQDEHMWTWFRKGDLYMHPLPDRSTHPAPARALFRALSQSRWPGSAHCLPAMSSGTTDSGFIPQLYRPAHHNQSSQSSERRIYS